MQIRAVKFRVGAQWRVGGLYLPPGPFPTPAVLMLHGFPGVQKNEDVAAELCRRGMTVFMPYFRGCWGSPGRFSIHGLLEDARAAARLLARYRHVDPERIGILGYSVGGWVALRLAAALRPAAVAVLAPALPRDDEPADADYLRRNAKVLEMPRLKEVWGEYLEAARSDAPGRYIPLISPTPLLLVQGLRDRMVPARSALRVWANAREPKELYSFEEEHEFQRDRPAVVAALCGWLERRLARPAPAPSSLPARKRGPPSREAEDQDFADFVDVGRVD